MTSSTDQTSSPAAPANSAPAIRAPSNRATSNPSNSSNSSNTSNTSSGDTGATETAAGDTAAAETTAVSAAAVSATTDATTVTPGGETTAEVAAETTEGETGAGQASHDLEPHAAFRRFMASGWAPTSDVLPAREQCAPYTAKRRTLLSTRFPGETLVIPSGGLRVRANDTDYPFRPGSDLFWLTGSHEPDAVLVLSPTAAGNHDAVLYVADRSDRKTSAFYTDRRYGELWVGPRPGVKGTAAALDVECRPLAELPDALAKLAPARTRLLRGTDQRIDDAVLRYSPGPVRRGGDPVDRDLELAQALSELRLVKDDFEVAALDEAIAATALGFDECVAELGQAERLSNGERWLEGTFWRRARVDGNEVGYGSIVACGHHATTLHWVRDDGPVRAGDLALLDMGVEGRSLYTADVTRTIPVSGTFSDVQRQVYEVVLRAQRAGIEAVQPGAKFLDPHRAAMRVVAEALHDWGLLPVSVDESLSEDPRAPGAGVHRRYTLHSTSHMLGLDVHDCAAARDESYRDGTLAAGMVLTVEPGLYFQPDDLTVPSELRGIGVRIEDDILVTTGGSRTMSDQLPREVSDLENWVTGRRAAADG